MKLERISIELAENGFTVNCHYKAEEGKGKKGEPAAMTYHEPEKHVFESAEATLKFVSGKLGKAPLGKANPGEYRKRRGKGEGEY